MTSTRKLAALFFVLFFQFNYFGQIKGIIRDGKNGEPIPGAKVALSSGEKLATNIAGEFLVKPSK